MKLTVLVDNNTYIDQYFYGEPGVSYYIEVGDQRILFDMGYSDIFQKNAAKLNIDLNELTHIVLSHGHNDHSRGLQFLNRDRSLSQIALIAHPDCFSPKYEMNHSIGAPYTEREISQIFNYHPCRRPYPISENLIFLGEIPRKNDFEGIQPIGIQKKEMDWENDYVMDDSALVYRNSEGIFIITGCSHSGICNIVQYAKEVCQEQRIVGILGGFHLLNDNVQLQKTIPYLKSCKIQRLYPCHCISLLAKAKMIFEALPIVEVGVGMKLSLSD